MADISKVQFFDIQESYGCGEPVSFRCRIVSDLIPSSKDWIGLYRVGWKLTADYVAYEWVSIPSGFDQKTEKEFVCTFKGWPCLNVLNLFFQMLMKLYIIFALRVCF